jgi:hypothetical protein
VGFNIPEDNLVILRFAYTLTSIVHLGIYFTEIIKPTFKDGCASILTDVYAARKTRSYLVPHKKRLPK